ncbi:MAG: hypothetical protein BRC22_02400 [Parcubacteria group bacterium QH_9_35_7]|nr:MAG: hypothetical protein BRC22_02400 [Parcubacteria group bacterium QH_9_35_7]
MDKFNYLVNLIKDSVFPKFCIYCDEEGNLICNKCKQSLNSEIILACPECRQKNDKGNTCKDCSSSLDRHIALFNYKDNRIKKLIRKFKYEYMTQILDSLRPLVVEFLSEYDYLFPEATIIPVPLGIRALSSFSTEKSKKYHPAN